MRKQHTATAYYFPAAPARSVLLIVLQLFLGIGAIAGGLAFVIDPTGGLLQMPVTMLERSPFNNFLIPGLLLITLLGIVPLIVTSALIRRWDWPLAEKLNVFADKHWSWTYTLYTGFALIIWITVQVYMLQTVAVIHLGYMLLGLLIQISCLLPAVQRKYTKH